MQNQLKNSLFVQNDLIQLGQMPGYGGYMTSINSENLFGKTFGNITRDVLQKNINKGSNLEAKNIYKSLFTESYQSPSGQNFYTKNQEQNFEVKQENYHAQLSFEEIQNRAYQ